MTTTTQPTPQKNLMLSYLELRRLIGWLGVLLPFLLALGTLLINALMPGDEQTIQPSISHYYYSIMHVLFVGTLCLLSGFLMCYRGPHKHDDLLSNLAGLCALGVAAFPTNTEGFLPRGQQYIRLQWWDTWVNGVHYGAAAALFVCFAFFCFIIFQDDDARRTADLFDSKKVKRNKIYFRCGVIILASIASIGVLTLYDPTGNKLPRLIFTYYTIFFETTALLAFGYSWLLKGTYDKIPRVIQPFMRGLR